MNETALLVLPTGEVLAVIRGADQEQALHLTRSSDGGYTWSAPVQLTGSRQHPADLVQLSNGTLLLTYGNRNPPYRIEGRVSRDGGHTWLDCLLTFSGHLYGYTVEAPRHSGSGVPIQCCPQRPRHDHLLLQPGHQQTDSVGCAGQGAAPPGP